jgi:hypothetical protein
VTHYVRSIKCTITIALLLATIHVQAQFPSTNTTISTNGITGTQSSLGIGNYFGRPNASEALVVGGNLSLHPNLAGGYRSIFANTTNGVLALYSNSNSTDGPCVEMYGKSHANSGQISFVSYKNNGTDAAYNFMNFLPAANPPAWGYLMRIYHDGRVSIGDVNVNTATKYGLYVADGIITEQVKVALKNTTDWSDYVFADNYNLMPLRQLNAYIKKNKHLPEVPSAEEVVCDGVNLAQMDATLLKKVEELTLYTIALQAQIDTLTQQVKDLSHDKH